MMGDRLVRKGRLFYDVCLEDRVPPDHLVRRLDAVLELSWLHERARAVLQPHGLPVGGSRADDPDDAARLLFSIRSDRRLWQGVDMSFAYRWFCGLGLEGRVPDHSTFSVNRHGRFRDSDVLAAGVRWQHALLPRQQVRLPRVSLASAMSSELTGAPGPT